MRVGNALARNCTHAIALVNQRIDVMHILMGQHT